MEFLLNISVHFTHHEDAEMRAGLIKKEMALAETFKSQGHLIRIWRTPCEFGNWSLWRAKDATELHEIVSSLPLYSWMKVVVHPLAKHALDPAGADGGMPTAHAADDVRLLASAE